MWREEEIDEAAAYLMSAQRTTTLCVLFIICCARSAKSVLHFRLRLGAYNVCVCVRDTRVVLKKTLCVVGAHDLTLYVMNALVWF